MLLAQCHSLDYGGGDVAVEGGGLMPDRLRCVFLNCRRLFAPRAAHGAPSSQRKLDEKFRDLAETLRTPFGSEKPDLVGICEVAAKSLAQTLAETTWPKTYEVVYAGSDRRQHTGVAAFIRRDTLSRASSREETSRIASARPYWLALDLQLQKGRKGAFWFVVNHWLSNYHRGEAAAEPERMRAAHEIAEFYVATARTTSEAMFLVGDFNCQPADPPFRSQKGLSSSGAHRSRPHELRGVRERKLVLRSARQHVFCYNPMWRFLGEPDPWEDVLGVNYNPPRPMGTLHHGYYGWLMLDQLLVTKRMLQGGQVIIREGSIRIVHPVKQCTDHCGLAFEFDC
jgi:exonuclease III